MTDSNDGFDCDPFRVERDEGQACEACGRTTKVGGVMYEMSGQIDGRGYHLACVAVCHDCRPRIFAGDCDNGEADYYISGEDALYASDERCPR